MAKNTGRTSRYAAEARKKKADRLSSFGRLTSGPTFPDVLSADAVRTNARPETEPEPLTVACPWWVLALVFIALSGLLAAGLGGGLLPG